MSVIFGKLNISSMALITGRHILFLFMLSCLAKTVISITTPAVQAKATVLGHVFVGATEAQWNSATYGTTSSQAYIAVKDNICDFVKRAWRQGSFKILQQTLLTCTFITASKDNALVDAQITLEISTGLPNSYLALDMITGQMVSGSAIEGADTTNTNPKFMANSNFRITLDQFNAASRPVPGFWLQIVAISLVGILGLLLTPGSNLRHTTKLI